MQRCLGIPCLVRSVNGTCASRQLSLCRYAWGGTACKLVVAWDIGKVLRMGLNGVGWWLGCMHLEGEHIFREHSLFRDRLGIS